MAIVDNKEILLGTLSDGDLRKAILNRIEINDSIQQIYQSNPTVIIDSQYKIDDVKKCLLNKSLIFLRPKLLQKKQRGMKI